MNKKLNEQQNRRFSFKKILLFGEIALVNFVALLISGWVISQLCSNFSFFTLSICSIPWLLAPFLGFPLFLILLKTRWRKFITLKSVTIFSAILALVIILSTISCYYETVPPKEVTNQWHCDEGQDISEVLRWMTISYGTAYPCRGGDFYELPNATQGTQFTWKYDESTQVITMTEHGPTQDIEDWKLCLRLDINFAGSHYTMTTYYVSDVNFTLFDPLLFEDTTWKGSLMWDDQGR